MQCLKLVGDFYCPEQSCAWLYFSRSTMLSPLRLALHLKQCLSFAQDWGRGDRQVDKTILVWYWAAKSSITFPLCIDALSRISKYFLVWISWCCKSCNKYSNQHKKIFRSHEPWKTKSWINLKGAFDLTALIILSLVPYPPDLNAWGTSHIWRFRLLELTGLLFE